MRKFQEKDKNYFVKFKLCQCHRNSQLDVKK